MATKRIWLALKEPRVVTGWTCIAWLVLAGIGLAGLTFPPIGIPHSKGPLLTYLWAWFFILGGALGLLGALADWWWIERSGIIGAITGIMIYTSVLIYLHNTDPPESELVGVGFSMIAVIFLIIRWHRIQGLQVGPRRHLRRRRAVL